MIIVNYDEEIVEMGLPDNATENYDFKLHVVMVTKTAGEQIKNLPILTLKARTSVGNVNPINNINTLAEFSSIGPTYDGRLKPDILGPGHQVLIYGYHGY